MNQYIIRDAKLNDLDILRGFEQNLIVEERIFDETIKADPVNYYDLGEMLADPDVKIVVAQSNAKLIGSGYARVEPAKAFMAHEQFAYLGFMYVMPEWRGKGVNKSIIENLKQWAVNRKVKEVRLDVYYENSRAIKAYEKSGFAKYVLEMRSTV
jgi:GNAT superfamily N-acetyltransferase